MKNHMHPPLIRLTLLFALLPAWVHAQPGSGIRLGEQSVLIPEVSFSVNYNDNVDLRRRAVSEGGERLDRNESDWFYRTEASLALRHFTDSFELNTRAWIGTRRYDEQDNLDRDTYGVSGGLFWTSPSAETTAGVNASYQRAVDRAEDIETFTGDADHSDELVNVSERVERDEFRTSINLSRQLIPRVRSSASYSLTQIDYNEDRFNDRTNHLASAELAYRMTDKTRPYLRGGIGLDDDDGFDGYAEKPFILLGVRYHPTDKLNLDAAVGYESYTRTPWEFEPNPDEQRMERVSGEEQKNSGLKYTLGVNYAATPKTRLSLNARTGYNSVATAGGTSREETAVSAALNHQTTRNLSQRVSAAWREDDYLSPVSARGEEFDERKETLRFRYGINYQTVRPWLSLFSNVSWEDGSSRIPGDDYTETQVTLGARARY